MESHIPTTHNVWRRAFVGIHQLPNSVDVWYELIGDGLMAKMMNQPAAVPELLQYWVGAYEPPSCNINCLQNHQPSMADFDCEAIWPFSDLENICTNPLASQ